MMTSNFMMHPSFQEEAEVPVHFTILILLHDFGSQWSRNLYCYVISKLVASMQTDGFEQ
ncbi:conserved hypothetical protein [Agrobacterium tumefaciens str. B6]|uniref:Uncharacterized protein n=1 Tax=Agrobacterium tumefaciens str. B6 TaxID=1183423 RepID=A0A822UX41_AGRTU|nr:conserved hypothetical protein [Agrobacterium tumefaciens str. B6]